MESKIFREIRDSKILRNSNIFVFSRFCNAARKEYSLLLLTRPSDLWVKISQRTRENRKTENPIYSIPKVLTPKSPTTLKRRDYIVRTLFVNYSALFCFLNPIAFGAIAHLLLYYIAAPSRSPFRLEKTGA